MCLKFEGLVRHLSEKPYETKDGKTGVNHYFQVEYVKPDGKVDYVDIEGTGHKVGDKVSVPVRQRIFLDVQKDPVTKKPLVPLVYTGKYFIFYKKEEQ